MARSRLPKSVQALVDRIEAFAGLPIQVGPNPRPPSATDSNPDAVDAYISPQRALILLRNKRFEPQGVLHELLRIERYWVEQIPQIVPLDDAPVGNWNVTGDIEGALERLVVVPKEADYGFEPYAYWTATQRTLWERYPWPGLTGAFSRRASCLLGSLTALRLTNDNDVMDLVRRCLSAEGLLREAEAFVQQVTDVIDNKQRMLRRALQYLDIPRADVKLIQFDVRRRLTYQLPF